MAFQFILTETRGSVGLITLNRPNVLNALNDDLVNELGDALEAFDADEAIGAIVLTGRMMDAAEAERAGLVSRVVPADKLLDEALAAALQICQYSQPSVMMAKEAVNRAFESPLAEGMLFERRLFHSLFGTEDQKEGMNAFVQKRKPAFKHR